MRREILFRGKTSAGEWVEGYYLNRSNDKEDIHCIMEKYPATVGKRVIPETVGQFTGHSDKNGKRIFEGDIVKGAWGTVFVVYYDECYSQFRAKKADGYAREIDYYGDSNEIEIIGNIHDNPELLK